MLNNTATPNTMTAMPPMMEIEPETAPATDKPTPNVLADGVVPEDGSMVDIPLYRIRRNQKIDPRHHRNKTKMASMLASFQREGIIQPITIRPVQVNPEDGADFEVVAGNTRFEGALALDMPVIPALVKHINAQEAVVMAGIENMQRQDLSPVEEGFHAARLLSVHNNDHAEVCKLLDWSESKLKSRVMLTHVNPSVQDALVQGDLKIGHVELLASVPSEQQDRIASKIIEQGMSVADARERLSTGMRQLSKACFDTVDCQGCRYNSDTTKDLFAANDGIQSGKCSNAQCWDQKTEAALNIIVTDAKADYGTVLRETEVPKDSYIPLTEEGVNGVGAAQKAACTSCEHYGCIINTSFGKEGTIQGEQCFNLECHTSKVAAYKDAKKVAETATQPTPPQPAADGAATPEPAPKATTSASAKIPATPAPLTPKTLKKGIREVALRRFSQMGQDAIAATPTIGTAIGLLTLYATFTSNTYEAETIGKAKAIVEALSEKASQAPALSDTVADNKALLLARLGVEELTTAMVALSSLTVWRRDANQELQNHAPYQNAARYAQATGVDRSAYPAMTEEYVKAQTKAGLLEDCKRSKFEKLYNDTFGEKSFEKLEKGKASELVETINKAIKDGSVFDGYEPVGFAPNFYYDEI